MAKPKRENPPSEPQDPDRFERSARKLQEEMNDGEPEPAPPPPPKVTAKPAPEPEPEEPAAPPPEPAEYERMVMGLCASSVKLAGTVASMQTGQLHFRSRAGAAVATEHFQETTRSLARRLYPAAPLALGIAGMIFGGVDFALSVWIEMKHSAQPAPERVVNLVPSK